MSTIMPDPGPIPIAEHRFDLYRTDSLRMDASLFYGADVDLFGGDELLDHDETDLERQARFDAADDLVADDPAYFDKSPLAEAADRYRARTGRTVGILAQRASAVRARTAVAA
ncbi:hypothetical protein ACFZDG_35615 [Kitasatospora xanthocidica]|uniref:hypothetical protein n=1 Tax=Kitasatospora xanthocidica TaxID=83382 RepID=UPI0036E7F94B